MADANLSPTAHLGTPLRGAVIGRLIVAWQRQPWWFRWAVQVYLALPVAILLSIGVVAWPYGKCQEVLGRPWCLTEGVLYCLVQDAMQLKCMADHGAVVQLAHNIMPMAFRAANLDCSGERQLRVRTCE